MLGKYMVHSQITGFFSAVLATVLITSEYFLLGEFYAGSGTLDNLLKANDGWFWIGAGHSPNYPAAIHDHVGFSYNYQAHRPPR
jgi:hypothetical protein